MLTALSVRSAEFPIVGKLGEIFSTTMKAVAITFMAGALILLVIRLVVSYVSDKQDSGKWWLAIGVWVIAAAVVAGGPALYSWAAQNLSV